MGGWADPPQDDTWGTMEYGQQVGSTHPTGMRSFLLNDIFPLPRHFMCNKEHSIAKHFDNFCTLYVDIIL